MIRLVEKRGAKYSTEGEQHSVKKESEQSLIWTYTCVHKKAGGQQGLLEEEDDAGVKCTGDSCEATAYLGVPV